MCAGADQEGTHVHTNTTGMSHHAVAHQVLQPDFYPLPSHGKLIT